MDSQLWTVYTDGSAFPNPGQLRIGGIVYAPDDSTACFGQALHHTGCNNEAEALAAIYALQWLHRQGAQEVRICTDNSILAEQMNLPHPKRIERLAAVYEQARALAQQFRSVHVQWIPRHKNTIADALARGESQLVGDPAA